MTSEEIDPRTINTIPCPQCHRFAVVTSTEREVAELESDDYEGMSEGQIADYENELAMGGGENWTELVESATCATCHVTLIRRTLGGVETVQSFDSEPAMRGKPAIATKVTQRPTAANAKSVAKKRTASKKARPGASVKKAAASKKAEPRKAKPKAKPSKAKPKTKATKAKPHPKARPSKAQKARHK